MRTASCSVTSTVTCCRCGNASRAQMAAMLVRVFGCTAGKDIAFFSDVNRDAWYYPELSTAVQMNILSGYGDGTIGPNRSINAPGGDVRLRARLCSL
ncbi:MAG: S-layer homology domain-containing protein [Oscillospiraceae bacterium]